MSINKQTYIHTCLHKYMYSKNDSKDNAYIHVCTDPSEGNPLRFDNSVMPKAQKGSKAEADNSVVVFGISGVRLLV